MNAKWIGFISKENRIEIKKNDLFGGTAEYFRKAFSLREKPILATLKISALGIFKAFINGKPISDEFFAPGWTNYNKRILLREYDVTDFLNEKNAISVCVGDGWYAGYLSIKGRNVFGSYPLSIWGELECKYSDGSIQRIVTDTSWLAGNGAIRQNDFLCGEIYDDRLCHCETSLYDFDDGEWENVYLTDDKTDLLSEVDYEPVTAHEIFTAKKISQNKNKYVYDFGQNFAGVVKITANGKSGSEIIIRHAEMLADDGELYTENLRTAKATDKLILSGREIEYLPTFTYHGFRYVEVIVGEGAELKELKGVAIYNDVKRVGEIKTDNKLVNQILSNVIWGMKSNFVDVPTDCPQRNERLGWTADTQIFSRTAMYLGDCKNFYNKYMVMLDDDRKGGSIPDVIPFIGIAGFDRAFWRDVAVVLPYHLYEFYGDGEQVKRFIPMIKDFLNLQMSTSEDYIWTACFFNDWLNIDENSPDAVLATIINVNCFNLAISLLKEFNEDCAKYSEFLQKVINSFNSKFILENGLIEGGTQTVYALAFRAGLISKETARVALLECFRKRNNHIHSGFCGIRYILPVLCDIGLKDLAYELITKETYPSWGYSILNGATTMWERWDSYVKGRGFGDAGMNSFNHYSFGSCGEWMFEYMLGIKPKSPAFKEIVVKPYVDQTGRVNSVSGSYTSASGKITLSWEKLDNEYKCVIDKPQTINADFVFDNVISIIQDGEKTNFFSANAKHTEVYFK